MLNCRVARLSDILIVWAPICIVRLTEPEFTDDDVIEAAGISSLLGCITVTNVSAPVLSKSATM